MKSRGEAPPPFEAVLACSPTQRTFRGDVHRIGRQRVEHLSQVLVRTNRNVDARVTWAGSIVELTRVKHTDFNAQWTQSFHQLMQGGHHPIDLWMPGIGDQSQLHAVTTCAGKVFTTTA